MAEFGPTRDDGVRTETGDTATATATATTTGSATGTGTAMQVTHAVNLLPGAEPESLIELNQCFTEQNLAEAEAAV